MIRRALNTFFLVAATVVACSCDKIPLFAPTASTITLSAPKRTLALNETVTVTAVLQKESGQPVQNGTVVRFTTTLGSITSAAETTNGIATAMFSAGTVSGTADVTATSGAAGSAGNGDNATATNTLKLTIGGANATSVVVNASPVTVPSTGGTSTITATVVDNVGNPVQGVVTTFSTTAGTLSASSATTDASGRAVVTLTTTRDATVTAQIGAGGTSAITGKVDVKVAASVGVTLAASTSPVAGQPMILTITAPTSGPPPNVTVTWGDGSSENIGVVQGTRTVSHTYAAPGSYTITARATAEGETTTTSTGVSVGAVSVTITTPTPSQVFTTPFTFTVTPVAAANPTNVVVDFGDGSFANLGPITTPTTVTRRYASPGSYLVRATQTNANGSSSTGVVLVQANP